MRIAQLIDSLTIGGAEKLQVTFMRTALAKGLQPTLITFNKASDQHYFRELSSMGIRIIEIKGRNLFDPVLFQKLTQTLRNENFDIVHTHLTYSIILGGIAGWLTGIPVVASLHNLGVHSWSLLESISLRFFTKRRIAVGWTVANSRQILLDQHLIDVVQNPVEQNPLLPLSERMRIRTEFGKDPSRLFLITVGRLDESKGYDDLLMALDEFRKTHPRVILLIAGGGPYLSNINEKIASLKLEDHVALLGLRSDIPKLLAASDIYVSASHTEGLPVSILEALAAGLPVVATSVGDVPLVVKPEFGICVPAYQPDHIVDALRGLADDPSKMEKFGFAGRDYVIRHHNADIWLDQLLNIYNQILSSKKNFGKKDYEEK